MNYVRLTTLALSLGMMAIAAAPAAAQGTRGTRGLTRIELLALQQQLRDDGCGVAHVTGVIDAPTKTAIARCKERYHVTGTARELLAAMNIGFPMDSATASVSTSTGKPDTTSSGSPPRR